MFLKKRSDCGEKKLFCEFIGDKYRKEAQRDDQRCYNIEHSWNTLARYRHIHSVCTTQKSHNTQSYCDTRQKPDAIVGLLTREQIKVFDQRVGILGQEIDLSDDRILLILQVLVGAGETFIFFG